MDPSFPHTRVDNVVQRWDYVEQCQNMSNSVETTLGNIGAMLENVETSLNVTCLNFVEQRVTMCVYWMPHSTYTVPTCHSGCRM